MDWGVGDLLAVTKLAWDLYHNCFLAAKEAPDEFRHLVTELGSLQGVLKNLRDDVNSDGSFVDKLDPQRKDMLERCLRSCFSTLQKLQSLVIKYRDMGLGDGLQFWRRISWTTKKKEISDMKARVMAHTCNISLCLSSIQNSSLARIEARLLPALERQESAQEEDRPASEREEDDDVSPYLKPIQQRNSPSMDVSDASEGLSRRLTESTLVDRPNYSPPMVADEFDSESVSPVTSSPRHRTGSMPSPRARRTSSIHTNNHRLTPSPSRRDEGYHDTKASARMLLAQMPAKFSRPSSGSAPTRQGTEKYDIKDELASAMAQLSKVKQHERATRPLRIPSRRNIPRPENYNGIKEEFEADADEEMQYRKLNMRDWLKIGTWWFLKAKYNLNSMEKPQASDSGASSSGQTNYTTHSVQGFLDLLKVSWIVFDVILNGDYEVSLRADENRNVLYNLVDGLDHEARIFRTTAPDSEALDDPDLSFRIWEPMQAQEEGLGDDFGESHNNRWVTVQQGDAGAMNEKALYRTFVDAAIGGKGRSVFPKGAPYLLILSTKEGESEPKVTICNQSGTLCLTRDFTTDDLDEFSAMTNPVLDIDYHENLQSLELSFSGMETCISFPNETDLQRFLQIPRAYFAAVKRREPRVMSKATETLLFKSSVDIIEQLHPSTMKLMSRKHRFESCDIRILETTCKEGWRTTRRLVMSASASERHPWCNEFFLPMDRVQLTSELPRQLTMKWSDCSQEDYSKTNGNYVKLFSHIYDDTRPNIAFSLVFNSEEDSMDFQRAILNLSAPVNFTWENGPSERGTIYEMVDTDPAPKKYKAILLIRTHLDWTYSQIFYHYRDTDFQYDSKSSRLHFPQLYYSTYYSTHYKEIYRPTQTPAFSHCEKRVNPTAIEFVEPESSVAIQFISALCPDANLVFARRAIHISTKAPSKLGGSTKSNKGAAEVFVWRQGNSTKVVSRWSDLVADKWISVAIPAGALKSARDNNRASMPQAKYDRGQMLDIGNLIATRPKVKEGARKEGYITWAFGSVRDQEEFVAAVEGKAPGSFRSPLDEMDAFINQLGSGTSR